MTQQSRLKNLADRLRHPAVSLTALGALTFLIYYGTLSFEFVWDDVAQIVDNPLIRSWHSLARIFQSDLWFHTSRTQSYYRPLFIVWETLNYSLFELKTWGWHLTTLLLHIGASLSVYGLARKLKMEHWAALIAATLFAVHPVHVECAAWISAGSDSMVTIFYVLAFTCFISSREPERSTGKLFLAFSFLFVVFAQFTKEMGITFAGVVALYVYITSPATVGKYRRAYNAVIAALPYALITAGYLVLRRLAIPRHTIADSMHSVGDVIVTLPLVLFNYLRILVYPVGLNGLYYTPYIERYGWHEFFLPVLALVAFVAVVWYWTRRKQDGLFAFSALWILATLSPLLYLRLFANGDFVRDRYLYLPSVGFAILIAKAIQLIPNSFPRFQFGGLRALTALVLCMLYVVGCASQQVYWANDLLVFSRGYSMSPGNKYGALGFAKTLIDRNQLKDALIVLERYSHEYPGDPGGYPLFAVVYFRSGLREQGRAALQRTFIYQSNRFLQSSMGAVELVALLGGAGEYKSARFLCSQVMAEEPNLYAALYNCGVNEFLDNHDDEAEALFRRAMAVAPGLAPPHYFLAGIMQRRGNTQEEENQLRTAVAMDPDRGPHYDLGKLLEASGRLPEAAEQYSLELKHYPENQDAAQRLAAIKAKQ